MFKILDKRNGEVTAEQQAVFNKISTNNADGYVDGFLNSLRIAKMSSNVISIDSGLLSIQGFRSVNDTLTTYTVSVTPSEPIPFQLVATYSHYISDENDTLEITTRPVQDLRREELFSGQNAVYEVELAEFNMTADGIADFKVTLEKIVYNEQDLSELLDKVTKAEQDSTTALEKVNELETQVIEKQGTVIKYGNEAQNEVVFDSNPQPQITANKNAIAEAQSDINDIVSGAQTVRKATQDANGNVIDTTYATKVELGDVSEFAVPSSVTGVSRDSGLWAISTGTLSGSFLLGTFRVYDTNISLHISGGIATTAADSITDVDVFISTANYVVSKAEYYVRHIYTNQLSGLYYTLDDSHNLRIFADLPEYGKVFVRAEVTGGTIAGRGSAELQYPSGGVYLERKDYFATDPSKLAPSTANGWTQTTVTGSLPSAGVYMIAVYHTPSDTQPHHYYNPAILVYDGAVGSCTMTDDTGVLLISMVVTPSGIQLARPVSPGSAVQSTNIYYKRIA